MKKALILSFFIVSLVLTGCTRISKETLEDPALIDVRNAFEQTQNFEPSDAEKQKIIELSDNGSVYYKGADGKRYIFPTPEIYQSWYHSYVPGTVMALEEIQKIPLGGNVTMKPGTFINTPTDFNVYYVDLGEKVRAVNEDVLKSLWGKEYLSKVVEIPNWYFTNYTYGDRIDTVAQIPIINPDITIDQVKNLDR